MEISLAKHCSSQPSRNPPRAAESCQHRNPCGPSGHLELSGAATGTCCQRGASAGKAPAPAELPLCCCCCRQERFSAAFSCSGRHRCGSTGSSGTAWGCGTCWAQPARRTGILFPKLLLKKLRRSENASVCGFFSSSWLCIKKRLSQIHKVESHITEGWREIYTKM